MQADSTADPLSTLFNPQGYLDKNVLHFRPLSAHVFSGIGFTTAFLHQKASDTAWHGRVVRGLAQGTAIVGYSLNTALALTEMITMLAVGSLAATVHWKLKGRSEFFQKYSIKCVSFGLNGGLMALTQLVLLKRGKHLQDHTPNAILNHGTYLGSAALSYGLYGSFLDYLADREGQAFFRVMRVIFEGIPGASHDIINAFNRDNGGSIRDAVSMQSMQQWFARLPNSEQHMQTFRDFNLSRLADPQYRGRLRSFLFDFLGTTGIVGQVVGSEIVLNNTNETEKAYRKELQSYVKEAIKQIHKDNQLASYLDEEGKGNAEAGREAITGLYPHTTIPLAHFAQLKELEARMATGKSLCPEKFENRDLQQYNERNQNIESACALLKELTEKEKGFLIEKLLKGSSSDTTEKVQALFIKIGQLAGSLHQGKLMSESTINTNNLDAGSNNLFQKAIQEGIAEIG